MNGFSGSQLQVLTCGNYPSGTYRIVRKELSRNTPEGRAKLAVEIEKTEILHAYVDPTLYQVPRILDCGDTWYDRSFIIGETIEAYLLHRDAREVQVWQQRLQQILKHWQMIPITARTDPEVFTRYLQNLWGSAVSSISACPLKQRYVELLRRVHQHPYPIPPAGFCHGDLALDNLLVDPHGQLWIIDPLLNVYETPWWDIGKLLQSTRANWRQLREGRLAPGPRAWQSWAEELLVDDRPMGLFFLLVVLLRIIRHAPTPRQKEAILIRAMDTAVGYLQSLEGSRTCP